VRASPSRVNLTLTTLPQIYTRKLTILLLLFLFRIPRIVVGLVHNVCKSLHDCNNPDHPTCSDGHLNGFVRHDCHQKSLSGPTPKSIFRGRPIRWVLRSQQGDLCKGKRGRHLYQERGGDTLYLRTCGPLRAVHDTLLGYEGNSSELD